MAHTRLLILSCFVFLSFGSKAGEDVTSDQLAGTWKIYDVKITPLGSGEKIATKENCYFADLYKAGLGLVFTADGKINYSNYGNPVPVRYVITNNVLKMFTGTEAETGTDRGGEEKEQAAESSVEFMVSLSNGVLTLTRFYPGYIESYTFTK